MDVSATNGSSDIFDAISVASSRGFLPALRAITIAALVEKSPKSRFLGTSRFTAWPSFVFTASDTYLYKFILLTVLKDYIGKTILTRRPPMSLFSRNI